MLDTHLEKRVLAWLVGGWWVVLSPEVVAESGNDGGDGDGKKELLEYD